MKIPDHLRRVRQPDLRALQLDGESMWRKDRTICWHADNGVCVVVTLRLHEQSNSAAWAEPGIVIEDLLVSVADKIWKNKRVPDLEDLVVTRLAEAGGRTRWEEFLAFDDMLTSIGNGADQRLAFQSSYSGDR